MKRVCAILLAVFCLAAAVARADGRAFKEYRIRDSSVVELTEGVTYERYTLMPIDSKKHSSQRVFLLAVTPAARGKVHLAAYPSADYMYRGTKPLTEILINAQQKSKGRILAGVNADFFDLVVGGSLGVLVREGEWLTAGEFPEGWAAGMTEDGEPVIGKPKVRMTLALSDGREIPIWALNGLRGDTPKSDTSPQNAREARADNRLVLYTSAFSSVTRTQSGGTEVLIRPEGKLTSAEPLTAVVEQVIVQRERGGSAIPDGGMVLSGIRESAAALQALKPGDRVRITLQADAPFDRIRTAAGGGRPDGGPLLVWQGRPTDLAAAKASVDDGNSFYRMHPRTVMAIFEDGSYFLMAVEGNRNGSSGLSLVGLQDMLLNLGVYTALNLDGGTSTTMAVLQNGQWKAVTDTTGGHGRLCLVGSALALVTE